MAWRAAEFALRQRQLVGRRHALDVAGSTRPPPPPNPHPPTSSHPHPHPQEGFLSGLSSPLYSLVYITFAVLGLGGGGVGGGAGGVLGLAAAGSRLPLWLLDAAAVSPLLAVVSLDVLWNMDTAARASPLLCTVRGREGGGRE